MKSKFGSKKKEEKKPKIYIYIFFYRDQDFASITVGRDRAIQPYFLRPYPHSTHQNTYISDKSFILTKYNF